MLSLAVLCAFFVSVSSASVPRYGLFVSTPVAVVTCEPALLTWGGGIAPYFVEIIPGGEVGAAPLETFPTQVGHSYSWAVNLAAGTTITVEVRDSTGEVQYSSPVTIQAGPSTSCVGMAGNGPLVVNTPAAVVTCEPVLLAWSGGEAPYYPSIIPGGEVSAEPLETFPEQTGTSYSWTVNLAAGTSVTIKLEDAAGEIVYSAPVTIQEGPSTSCIGS